MSAQRPELSARVGFGAFALDRRAARRDDAGRIEALFSAADARTVVVGGEVPLLRREGDALGIWHRPEDVASFGALARVFLGVEGEAGRFALAVPAERVTPFKEPDARYLALDLRSIAVQELVSPADIAALGAGKALVDWHMRHGFCARCGQPTQATASGFRRDCPACSAQHFPRTDPVVIMLAVRGERCLLARQPRFMPGMYSALAGFVEPGETMEDAVRREIHEEAGLVTGRVRYLASQPWPFPSSLMIGCLAEALTEEIVLDGEELEDGRWFTREEVRLMMTRAHPEQLYSPQRLAIASTLVHAWAVKGEMP